MLTGDLVRYSIDETHIFPLFISRRESRRYLNICQEIIRIFSEQMGKPRKHLSDALEQFESASTEYKIYRGLAKLLFDRCIFTVPWNGDCAQLRQAVFEKAQDAYPIVLEPDLLHQTTQRDVLRDIGRQFNETPDEVESLLYGDLSENQILIGWDKEIGAQELLRRYNVAIAQGILYRAVRMRIWLRGDFKTVFKYIKLAQLIHEIRPIATGGYEIMLNGPASILRRTQKYGIHMALFLPALLLATGWRMSALIDTEKGPKTFFLDDTCGLHTYYRKEHPFDSSVEEKFFKAFQSSKTEWEIHREAEVVDLKETVLIPDFTFSHPDGRCQHLEIVGFWTPEYLEKKLAKLKKADRDDMIIAVNETLNCSKDDFHGRVIFFKTGLRPQKVIEMLEEPSGT
jgi:predicted nuclease of restriction endonuclease-like RecB superfamily